VLTMDAPPRKKRCLASSRDAEAASQGDAILEGDHTIEEVLSDEELRPFTPREPLCSLFINLFIYLFCLFLDSYARAPLCTKALCWWRTRPRSEQTPSCSTGPSMCTVSSPRLPYVPVRAFPPGCSTNTCRCLRTLST
jgi:hypothetical protein